MAEKIIDDPTKRQVFTCDQCTSSVIYNPKNIVKGFAPVKTEVIESGTVFYIDCLNQTPHTNVCIVK